MLRSMTGSTNSKAMSFSIRSVPPNPTMVGYTIFPKDPLTAVWNYSFADKPTLDKFADRLIISPLFFGCVDYFFLFGEMRLIAC